MSAAKTGDLETVQSLLRNGADINYTDKVSTSNTYKIF